MRWPTTSPFLWSTSKVDDGSWFSIVERDNPFMENLMNRMVVDFCRTQNYDKKKKGSRRQDVRNVGTDRSCDLCGDYPCVIVQRAAVVLTTKRTRTHLQYRKQD
jgi:hypothetical protein